MRLAESAKWTSPTRWASYPHFMFDMNNEGVGADALALALRVIDAEAHYRFPLTRETIMDRFYSLVSEWQTDTQLISSTTNMVLHKAYQEIIGLGPVIIPLLLRELQNKPDHWFAALKALTGVDPVAPSDRGRLGAMTAAWLEWGRNQGYTW